MLPVLEKCAIDCALFGNHEFGMLTWCPGSRLIDCFADFGLDYLAEFSQQTNFPWLMSNAFDRNTERPLGDGKVTHVIDKNGIKVDDRHPVLVSSRLTSPCTDWSHRSDRGGMAHHSDP